MPWGKDVIVQGVSPPTVPPAQGTGRDPATGVRMDVTPQDLDPNKPAMPGQLLRDPKSGQVFTVGPERTVQIDPKTYQPAPGETVWRDKSGNITRILGAPPPAPPQPLQADKPAPGNYMVPEGNGLSSDVMVPLKVVAATDGVRSAYGIQKGVIDADPTNKLNKHVQSGAMGVTSGVSVGTLPAVAGAYAAGTQGLSNLANSIQGKPIERSMGDAYQGSKMAYLDFLNKMRDQSPVAYTGGEIVGGLATPGMGPASEFVSAGKTLGGRVLRGSVVGGGLGAVAGAGGAMPGHEAEGAAAGGATGAVLGGTVPSAVEGVSGAARSGVGALRRMATPADAAASGAVPALAPVSPQVPATIARKLTESETTIPQMQTALDKAPPGTLPFQAGDFALENVARAVAQHPGPGQKIIGEALQAQLDDAPNRIRSTLGDAFGGDGKFWGARQQMMADRKASALPFKDAAFAEPMDPATFKSTVQPILSRVPQRALNYAEQIAKAEGRDPTELGMISKPNPGGGTIDTQVENPTFETLHYIKKGLDQDLEQFRNPTTGKMDFEGSPLGAAVNGVRGNLGRTMRDINPAYDEFARRWGDVSDHIQALDTGRNIFSSKPEMTAERLKDYVAGSSEPAQDAYRRGVGEALIDKVRRQGVAPLRSLLKDQEIQDRVRLAFPDQASFDRFMATADHEVKLANSARKVMGGSQTTPLATEQASLNGDGGFGVADAVGALGAVLHPAAAIPFAAKATAKAAAKELGKNAGLLRNPKTNAQLARALISRDEMAANLAASAGKPSSGNLSATSARAALGATPYASTMPWDYATQ